MKKLDLIPFTRLIGVSLLVALAAFISLWQFANWADGYSLLASGGFGLAAFVVGLYILLKKIPSPAASATTPPTTTPAAKPAAKKKWNWDSFWIFATGAIMAPALALFAIFLFKPAVEDAYDTFIKTKPAPQCNHTAIQTLGNDPLTPYIPQGCSYKGMLVYDNVLIDLKPGQECTVATLVKGQRYTWKLNNSFYLVIRDGLGHEKLIAEPCGSDIVQEATGDGDLVIKSDRYAKGMFRMFSDKDPVFKRLPIFACILSKNCSTN
ncbi:MAG: hypothetical protein V1928_04255 [Parcubacteria group bacterium]